MYDGISEHSVPVSAQIEWIYLVELYYQVLYGSGFLYVINFQFSERVPGSEGCTGILVSQLGFTLVRAGIVLIVLFFSLFIGVFCFTTQWWHSQF